MLFNSLNFLIFFPIAVLLYWVLPHKARWVWLLVASYYFYMCWNASYALLLATSTVITYLSGLLIGKANRIKDDKRRQKLRKLWVFLSFALNLGILFFFKYFNFAVDNLNLVLDAFHMKLLTPEFDILLPVGISFYTFQALSYTVDIYRGDLPPEKNLGKYALFVSFFPQLVAGPIERSKNLITQIHEKHTFCYSEVKNGLLLMLWGFFQKLVIADRAAILVNQVFNQYTEYAGFQIAIAVVLFAMQIYCDFAGYSNIAIGAAHVMGFSLMKNFDRPYFSKSIPEFWRRWHISLSTWFRDYLYIPMGGNRKGVLRKYFNIMVTFLASGLWHGASWNYVVWGFLHGLYQVIGGILKPVREAVVKWFHIDRSLFSNKLLRILWTFLLVNFAWIFFRAPGISEAFGIIGKLFSSFNPWIFFDGSLYTLGLVQKDFWMLVFSLVILAAVSLMQRKGSLRESLEKQNIIFRWCLYFAALFFVLIFGVYGPNFDASAFIYFQF
jgi:alginate O-acetyltransferase complex protein AlgI